MGLSTYTELKARVVSALARSDLTSLIQDFVATAENAIFERLRVAEMEKIDATLTPTSGVIALPSDFMAVGELRLADNLDVELFEKPSKALFRLEEAAFGSGYGYWSKIGTSLHIRPTPSDSQTYWLKYLASPLALTETTQETNSIFPAYADVYLYGALWQAFEHVRKFDLADRYEGRMLARIERENMRYIEEKEGSGELELSAPVVA